MNHTHKLYRNDAAQAPHRHVGICRNTWSAYGAVRCAAYLATAVLSFLAAPALAAYDVTIAASGTSSGGAWVGNTWTPSASGSTVLASEIATHLGTGATVISTAGAGADNGDIFVNGAIAWSANLLTLNAQRHIAIKASANASGTASLALEYGQTAVAAGNTAAYTLSNGAKVNLPAGANFSTKLGSDGATTPWTVITSLGVEGDATVAPGVMTLQGMNTGLAGKYVLGADINASGTSSWNASAGFTPVGFVAFCGACFTGKFDGLGHTISNLFIDRMAGVPVGLFGNTNNATLQNVGLLNVNLHGDTAGTGALAGKIDGTTAVRNSYADGGSVRARSHYVGGLVGIAMGATSIGYSYANISVESSNGGGATDARAGGLVGLNNGSISYSYATGSVTGNAANPAANVDIGGLVGIQNSGSISNSYATGAVSAVGGGTNLGGLVGNKAGGTVTGSYWNTQTTGQATSAGSAAADGKTTAEMKQIATFTGGGWDIDDAGGTGKVWRIYEGNSYPLLRNFLAPLTVTASAASKVYDGLGYSGGNGVTYSTPPNANLLGSVVYGGTAQGAITVGSYVLTPSGQYSNQRGYDVSYAAGTLTIVAPAAVAPPPPAPTIAPLFVALPIAAVLPPIVNMADGEGPSFMDGLVYLLSAAVGQPLRYAGQNAQGTVTLSGYNGGNLAFIPHTFQTNDTRANGVYALGDGRYQVVRGGQSLIIAPALVRLDQLLSLFSGVSLNLGDNGVITATLGNVIYVVQPGVSVQLDPATGSARMSMGADGNWHFIDALGNNQILYPAFADVSALRNALQSQDTAATVAIQLDGTASIVFKGQHYTLVPDLALSTVPAPRVGQNWWQESATRFWVVNAQPLGTAQGFTVRR